MAEVASNVSWTVVGNDHLWPAGTTLPGSHGRLCAPPFRTERSSMAIGCRLSVIATTLVSTEMSAVVPFCTLTSGLRTPPSTKVVPGSRSSSTTPAIGSLWETVVQPGVPWKKIGTTPGVIPPETGPCTGTVTTPPAKRHSAGGAGMGVGNGRGGTAGVAVWAKPACAGRPPVDVVAGGGIAVGGTAGFVGNTTGRAVGVTAQAGTCVAVGTGFQLAGVTVASGVSPPDATPAAFGPQAETAQAKTAASPSALRRP